jgi:hypothetical protein
MWLTIFMIALIIMITLILHDISRILKLQDELIKEQYIMRGELNAILDMASLGTSYMPKFSFPDEKDETTTVEVNTPTPE